MREEEIRRRLASFRVGIAGCGGLGSNCAVALARVGIGTLVLADFDVVSSGNLNRQYYFADQVGRMKTLALRDNIARIDPEVKVIDHPVKLTEENTPEIFSGCDVIVEAFDAAAEKQMLIETLMEQFPKTPVVMGLGMAGYGMNDSIHCRKSGNIFICGDEITEIGPEMPPLGPRVGIVANMQANTVLELLLDVGIDR